MSDWLYFQQKKLQTQVKSLRDQFIPRRILNTAPVPIPSATVINPSVGFVVSVETTFNGPPSNHTYNVADLITGAELFAVIMAGGMRLSNVIYTPLIIGQYVILVYGVTGVPLIVTPELPQTGTC